VVTAERSCDTVGWETGRTAVAEGSATEDPVCNLQKNMPVKQKPKLLLGRSDEQEEEK